MAKTIDRALLAEVSALVAGRMGLDFPEERWPDLARGLGTACKEMGFEDPGELALLLTTSEITVRQIETLASHLTVGETYFLRDPGSFEILEQEILPPVIARRRGAGRTLRLWSAGCCTGEEAYSLAITCARALPDIREWNVSILATDINPKFLKKAEAGIYSEWSFRGAPGWLRERFFSPARGREHAIYPEMKRYVHLAYLNLAEDAYPSLHNQTNAMDVILCRNVIMYFTPDHQRRVVAALHRCLVEGGCLLVNPAEASTSLFQMFDMESIGGVTLYRKASRPARVGPAWVAAIAPVVPIAPVVEDEPVAPTAPAPPIQPFQVPRRENPLVMARKHADQGRLEQALASCEDAIQADRTSPAAHFLRAAICQELGRTDEAIASLGKVLYIDQDFILAHHVLGGIYRRMGKQKESRRHLDVTIALLAARGRDEIVPESDGMTAGRLMESARAMAGA